MKYLLFTLINSKSTTYLNGKQEISYHEYESINSKDRIEKAPFCGFDYTYYDVRFITAVKDLEDKEECEKCLNVTSPRTKNFVFVLGVDQGGRGLDISRYSFIKLFGGTFQGHDYAEWNVVDDKYCANIYLKQKKKFDKLLDLNGNVLPPLIFREVD